MGGLAFIHSSVSNVIFEWIAVKDKVSWNFYFIFFSFISFLSFMPGIAKIRGGVVLSGRFAGLAIRVYQFADTISGFGRSVRRDGRV